MAVRFNKASAQGDVYLRRIDELPDNITKVDPVNGEYIVTHSETGHNHVMEAKNTEVFALNGSEFFLFLKVNEPTALRHLRDHDTHDSIIVSPGIYQVRRQREYTPEGFRKAQD